MVMHVWGSEGETGEWSGWPVPFTLPRNMVYPTLLPLMRTHLLPVVDWTDAHSDLNGLVRFTEKRNLISSRVPSHFQSSLSTSLLPLCWHVTLRGDTLHLHSQIEVRRNSSMHSRRAQFGWRRQTHLLSDLTPKQEHPLDVGEETNWKFENSEQENVHSWSSMNRETVRTSSTVPCFFFGPVLEGWDPSALQSNEWGVSHITDTAVKKERCSQSDCSAPTPNITNQISYIIKAMICILFCMSAEITIALREEHKLRLQMKKFMSSSSSSSSYSSSSR